MATDAVAEEWRPVEGFEGYEVSTLGRIRSWRKNSRSYGFRNSPRVLSASIKNNGYLQVCLWQNGHKTTVLVHTVVATTFHGPRPAGQECRHKDGVKTNNAPGNLIWGTPSENQMDSVGHGTHAGFKIRGEAHYRASITEDQASGIRQMALDGLKDRQIVSRTGLPLHLVKSVRLGYVWKFGEGRAYGNGRFSKAQRVKRASDRTKRGLAPGKGGTATLAVETVLEVRRLAGLMQQKLVAEQLGLSKQTVSAIVNRKTWKHI